MTCLANFAKSSTNFSKSDSSKFEDVVVTGLDVLSSVLRVGSGRRVAAGRNLVEDGVGGEVVGADGADGVAVGGKGVGDEVVGSEFAVGTGERVGSGVFSVVSSTREPKIFL